MVLIASESSIVANTRQMRCSKCGSERLRRSAPFFLLWRCEVCDHRSFKPARKQDEVQPGSGAPKTSLRARILNRIGKLFGLDFDPYEGE